MAEPAPDPSHTPHIAWVERALVPVGLISYSLYLWHQPVQLKSAPPVADAAAS